MNAVAPPAPTRLPRRERIDAARSVSIRPIDPSDAPGLADFYARLSPESRRRRFLGPAVVDDALIARFTDEPDGGLVAVLSEPGPRDGEIVGHASVQADGADRAELAFAVADELQGRGLGRILVEMAAELARRRGFREATASLLADNAPMRRLLHGAGAEIVTADIDGGVEEIRLRLPTSVA